MNAIDLAKSIIDRLVVALPSIRCQYEYVEFSDTHLVEVLPVSVYESTAFEEAAEPLLMEFISHFPAESLCFVSEDSLSAIEIPIYKTIGKEYQTNESEELLYKAEPTPKINSSVNFRVKVILPKLVEEKFKATEKVQPGPPNYAMAA